MSDMIELENRILKGFEAAHRRFRLAVSAALKRDRHESLDAIAAATVRFRAEMDELAATVPASQRDALRPVLVSCTAATAAYAGNLMILVALPPEHQTPAAVYGLLDAPFWRCHPGGTWPTPGLP